MLGSRVNMNEIVERKYVGDVVELKVVRDKKPISVDIELKRFLPYLIQANQYRSETAIRGLRGAVVPAGGPQHDGGARHYESERPLSFQLLQPRRSLPERPQIVVLTDILPDEINTHFDLFRHQAVDEINGKKIRTLKDAYEALQNPAPADGFHVIRFLGEGRAPRYRSFTGGCRQPAGDGEVQRHLGPSPGRFGDGSVSSACFSFMSMTRFSVSWPAFWLVVRFC